MDGWLNGWMIGCMNGEIVIFKYIIHTITFLVLSRFVRPITGTIYESILVNFRRRCTVYSCLVTPSCSRRQWCGRELKFRDINIARDVNNIFGALGCLGNIVVDRTLLLWTAGWDTIFRRQLISIEFFGSEEGCNIIWRNIISFTFNLIMWFLK